jgi:hypothetical protein
MTLEKMIETTHITAGRRMLIVLIGLHSYSVCRGFESCRGTQVRALITDHGSRHKRAACPLRARWAPEVPGSSGVCRRILVSARIGLSG